MNDDRTLQSLRAMAWERAKGELRSMLTTYYPDYELGIDTGNTFEKLNDCIKQFIEKVEDEVGI